MTIKAPAWCSNAIPTARGWEDPVTGEVYQSARFTQEQLDAFNGVQQINEVPVPQAQVLTEAPVGNKSLDEMTKLELEALGRQNGIELDRREKKSTLVGRMIGILKD